MKRKTRRILVSTGKINVFSLKKKRRVTCETRTKEAEIRRRKWERVGQIRGFQIRTIERARVDR